jgi:hypothetical protein
MNVVASDRCRTRARCLACNPGREALYRPYRGREKERKIRLEGFRVLDQDEAVTAVAPGLALAEKWRSAMSEDRV